ncbi:MAG: hypothetical protein KDA99_12005, partial [Planctomycetales bacterium]|nr:hypothetical protein [Planctomycetales bacterium]
GSVQEIKIPWTEFDALADIIGLPTGLNHTSAPAEGETWIINPAIWDGAGYKAIWSWMDSGTFARNPHGEVTFVKDTVGGLLGDYNGNGEVDAADYTIWKDAFGSTTDLAADGNGNGEVDAADYTIWKDNFGNTAGAVASTSAVPEPGSLLIVGVLALLSLGRFRSRLSK